MATDTTDPELEQATWNLEDLVDGQGADGVQRLLDEAQQRADAFAETYAGRIGELDGPRLAEAMRDLERIGDLGGRAGSYAQLDFSVDTQDPARGALVAKVTELSTAIETKLVFFELEWAAVDDERAEELLAHPDLDFARHYLRTARRYRPHLLSEPEEKLMAEKAQTGRSAWGRLFAELMAQVEVDGEPLEVALSRLMHPDREVRRTTAEGVTKALEPGLRTRAYIFNTLVLDKAVDDRLRSYSSWIQSRNLSNEASDESVAALVEAVKGRYEIARRWYRLKAKLLGIDRLADYDRIAPVTQDQQTISWRDAREMVLDSYTSFSPDLGKLAGRFFDERWIDAPLRPRKRGGAFCAYTVPSVHPYVLLNWTSKRRDVLTLAHELGHGVHAALAREQGLFQQGTPLTLAETASVFGEELVFGRLLDEAEDAESRLSLLAEAMEGQIATVFRQIAMNRFEDSLHTARRSEGELAVERIGELWRAAQEDLLGDAVEVTEGYGSWWSYVPHFVNTPGYVYAYAYGQLLALSVYRRYEEEGASFVPSYLELLRAGGSRSPEELGAIVGVDLADPGFWDAGLDLVERQLEAAEEAAREARGVTP
ncbi:MAG TPA: M3 family oligoendopeptidase [Solirubrobacteraceae bacterium]|jgi:oligoendopeptidase F